MILIKVDQVLHDTLRVILDDQCMTIKGIDQGGLFELRPNPTHQSAPKIGSNQNHRSGRYFAGLHESDRFKELVQRPEAARQNNIGQAVHEKSRFS